MSKFLTYKSFLVDIGTPLLNWMTEFQGHLTAQGWRVLDSDTVNFKLLVQPPATETVGNSFGEQALRVSFTSAQVRFHPAVRQTSDVTQVAQVYAQQDEPYYPLAVTVNGIVVAADTTLTGRDAKTADAYNKFITAQAQHPAELGGLVAGLETVNGHSRLRLSGKTGSDVITLSALNGGVAHAVREAYVAGTWQDYPGQTPLDASVGVDFATGFIYYLSVHSRSLLLSTKTTARYFGPLVANWADNAEALRQAPVGCMPLELLVATSDINPEGNNPGAANRCGVYGHLFARDVDGGIDNGGLMKQFGRDVNTALDSQPSVLYAVPAAGLGDMGTVFNGLLAGQVAKYNTTFSMQPLFAPAYRNSNYYTGMAYGPAHLVEDAMVSCVTATSESLHFARRIDLVLKLAAPLSAGATSLSLVSAAALPASGTVLIGAEIIKYAGVSGNTLTGLSRAAYGTASSDVASGVDVFPGSWYLKINNGLQYVGADKPVA